jgi:hypothetical protein
VEDTLDEPDKHAEIHEIKEDIIDEKTGKKIGERTTRTAKSADSETGRTPRSKFIC